MWQAYDDGICEITARVIVKFARTMASLNFRNKKLAIRLTDNKFV